MTGPESMRGRELERVFEFSSFLREYEEEIIWSFIFLSRCWPVGLREDSRELLALSLREKRQKWGENSDLHGPVGNERKGVSWMF